MAFRFFSVSNLCGYSNFVNRKGYVCNIFKYICWKNFFWHFLLCFPFFISSGCENKKNQAGKSILLMNYYTVMLIIFLRNVIFRSHFERRHPLEIWGIVIYLKNDCFKLIKIWNTLRKSKLCGSEISQSLPLWKSISY